MSAALTRLVCTCTIAAAVVVAAFPAPARADGDPASDVLAAQNVFLASDANASPAQQQQLEALVQAATRAGDPIRVALIASPADLGSINELWRQPQTYAKFLGEELSLIFRGTVLVVMPNGYGVFRAAGVPEAQRTALASVPAPSKGLAPAAAAAITKLAATTGKVLAVKVLTASAPSTVAVVPWIVFAAGFVLILLAWIASLRARPLRSRAVDQGAA